MRSSPPDSLGLEPAGLSTKLMAFRLRSDESVPNGLRRLARKELQRARTGLRSRKTPSDEAIHEARKSVKKSRAILQLIEDDDGRGLDGCRKRLRSVNRRLTELRDADVMMETAAAIRKKHPQVFSQRGYASIRRTLTARKRRATKALSGGGWKAVGRQLRRVRRAAKRWRPAHGGAGAVARGIRAMHQRGRKAMKRAHRDQRAEDFHAWRKEMKALWYALRLAELSDSQLRRDMRALHLAETWLGQDHNLVVLCEELPRDASACRGRIDVDRLHLIADRDECRLREKAIARARHIYERSSDTYARAIARAWHRAC